MPQDNLPLDATPPAGSKLASREFTYSGQLAHGQAFGLVEFSGPDDAKSGTDVALGTIIGPTNETPPATDTGVAGLNGMIKRLCQLLTLLLARFPTALSAGGFLQMSIAADPLGSVAETTNNSAVVSQGTAGVALGATLLPAKFAPIVASAIGDTVVVAAVATKKLRVLAYVLTQSAAVNAKFRSATNDKSGLLYQGVSPGYCPLGWFETNVGEALNINLSGNVAVGGHLTYCEV